MWGGAGVPEAGNPVRMGGSNVVFDREGFCEGRGNELEVEMSIELDATPSAVLVSEDLAAEKAYVEGATVRSSMGKGGSAFKNMLAGRLALVISEPAADDARVW